MQIIVRMPNWIGDVVMATPVVADLRRAFPDASLTAMCQQKVAPLLFGNPHLDEIFSFSRPNGFLHRQERRDMVGRLQQGKYDVGVLLTNSFSSAYWLVRGKVKRRIGFATDMRRLLLTDPVAVPPEKGKEHLVMTYKRLLSPLGIPLSDTSPELFVTPEERQGVTALMHELQIPSDHTLIGINPLAAYGEAKCWPKERFRETALRLSQDPKTTVLFFGEPSAALQVKEITQGLRSNVINLAGHTTLREFLAWLEKLDLFLTNDSGPMHLAAALKTPLLALFGSTNEIATGPYEHGQIIHKHVECSPCYLKKCPIDFRCMKRITVDEVVATIQRMLKENTKGKLQ